MTSKQLLLELLYRFLQAGLITKDIETLLDCFSPDILGIGLGEQGFVTSLDDVRAVIENGNRVDDPYQHHLTLGRTEIRLHSDTFATVCAEVYVHSSTPDGTPATGMNFLQLLTAQYQAGSWKICALHASTPVLTEEELESYPLRIADKTLQSLKKRIGEQAYQAEEQYRQAILSDTVAFYIVNFSTDRFEKCQCDPDLCAYVDEGDFYGEFLQTMGPNYLLPADAGVFMQLFAKENILQTMEQGDTEISMDYQLRRHSGGLIWVQTVMRLIVDCSTGDRKGIVYVREIDQRKRAELELAAKAATDGLTGLYNKTTMTTRVTEQLGAGKPGQRCCLAVLDIDNFKDINDNYGHPVGDWALVAVAHALRSCFAAPALLARVGGDEFSIFVPNCGDTVLQQFDLFMKHVSSIQLSEAPAHTISCSIGAVVAGCDSLFELLYRSADEALYTAKRNGKNRLELATLPQSPA